MVALAARVPALSLRTVPAVMVPPLPGTLPPLLLCLLLLLRLLGLLCRCILTVLLGLLWLF